MNFRKTILLCLSLTLIAALVACSSSSNNTPATVTPSTSSNNQSVTVGGAFAALSVTVTNSSGNPVSGATVTFTAPATGASGTFASNSTNTETDTTNSSGVATSTVFTANTTAGTYSVQAAAGTVSGTFTLTNTAGAAATIAYSSPANGAENAAINGTYAPLAAIVTDSYSNPVSGASVTFTVMAGSGAASASFATGGATDMETTGSTGIATTSQTLTANATLGQFPVVASSGTLTPVTFTLTNASGNLAITSGNGQSIVPSGSFAPLVSTVTDASGNPLQSISITYTITAGTSTATFSGTGTTTEAVTTDSNGNATVSDLTASATAGNFTVTAAPTTVTLAPASVTFNETIATSTPVLGAGNYAFSLAGANVNDTSQYYVAGVFCVTSAGQICSTSSGEQDYRDAANYGTQDLINPTGSNITTTADGNVQIVLVTCLGSDCTQTDTAVGVSGVETINATLLPNKTTHAFITEFDASGAATGTIRLQDSTAASTAPSGGYAFEVSGYDGGEVQNDGFVYPLAIGGVLNVSGTAITASGTIFDANDDASGTTFQNETIASGTVSGPDSFGRVTFSIVPTDSTDFPAISWVGYIASSSTTYLVETSDSYAGTTGGIAYSQGSNTGTFGTSSVAGNAYGAVMTGGDSAGGLQLVTELTLGSTPSSGATGYMDFNDLGNTPEPASPDPVAASSYTVDSYGRVTLTITDAPAGTDTYNLTLYLDGNGEAVAISLDSIDFLGGIFGGQLSNTGDTDATFTGNYAGTFFGLDAINGNFFSAVGLVTATGTTDTFSSINTDLNAFGATSTVALTGTYTYIADSNGFLSPAGITGLDVDTPSNNDTFSIYEINAGGDGVLIETDTNQLTLGIVQSGNND
jgi:hypothetical protein